MYNSTQVASERNLWLRSLASSNEPYIIQQYLDSVFNRSKVRSQDVRTVIATIAKNPAGSQVIRRRKFVKNEIPIVCSIVYCVP